MFALDDLKRLQLALTGLGLYKGNIDGLVGPQTLLAIQRLVAVYAPPKSVFNPPVDTDDDVASQAKLPDAELDGQGASIDQALIFTLKNEGGYSNHPNDTGGPTNRGITAQTLGRYLGKTSVTAQEVQALDYETTTKIYKKYYWDVMNLDRVLDQGIATALFDMGVLCGTGTAARLCQEVLGISITKKMDQATLDRLNTTRDDHFIPAFAQQNTRRFEAIVAAKPDKKVFLKGWKNRANRLLTLVNDDDIDPMVESTNLADTSLDQTQNILLGLIKGTTVDVTDIQNMIDYQKAHAPTSNPRYWAVFKIKEHSKNKRLYVFDRTVPKVSAFYACHGKNSDPNHDGLATEFSNQVGSLKSALGLYRTAETYQMATHGRALRLDGLDASNNNARQRGIVFHGVPYANASYVQKNGKCGRTHGCPAVDYADAQALIDQLKGGSLLLLV